MNKKIIVVIIILSIMYSLSAIDTSITIGYQKKYTNDYKSPELYIDIDISQDIGDLSIYGNYRNEMDFSRWNPLRFAPKQDYYTVGASYDFNFATIRLEHMCMHPVVSQSSWSGLQGGYTKLEVQL